MANETDRPGLVWVEPVRWMAAAAVMGFVLFGDIESEAALLAATACMAVNLALSIRGWRGAGLGVVLISLPVIFFAGWSPKIAGWIVVGVLVAALASAIARYVVNEGRKQRGAVGGG